MRSRSSVARNNFGVFDFDLVRHDSLARELQLLFLLQELNEFVYRFAQPNPDASTSSMSSGSSRLSVRNTVEGATETESAICVILSPSRRFPIISLSRPAETLRAFGRHSIHPRITIFIRICFRRIGYLVFLGKFVQRFVDAYRRRCAAFGAICKFPHCAQMVPSGEIHDNFGDRLCHEYAFGRHGEQVVPTKCGMHASEPPFWVAHQDCHSGPV